MCVFVCGQAGVRVYQVMCENSQNEAFCRLGGYLEAVLDSPSVTNVQIYVVEIVAVHLLLTLRLLLFLPSVSHMWVGQYKGESGVCPHVERRASTLPDQQSRPVVRPGEAVHPAHTALST